MPRIRYIKPDFFSDTTLSELNPVGRLCYIGMFCHMDRQGVGLDDPKLLKREIFPYDKKISPVVVESTLSHLATLQRILRFIYDGKRYFYCPRFERHQNFHPGEKLKFPVPADLLKDLCRKVLLSHKVPQTDQNASCREQDGAHTGSLPVPQTPGAEIEDCSRTIEESPGSIVDGKTHYLRTWNSYRQAYIDKYGEPPVYNAKVSGQLRSLLTRVSPEEAPDIARFFISHNDRHYLKSMHPLGMLLKDAEKLRTEWATGRIVDSGGALRSELLVANANVMKNFLAKKGLVDGS